MIHSYNCCIYLNKSYIKSNQFKYCNKYIRISGYIKYKILKIIYSDTEQKYLVKIQKNIAEKRYIVLTKLIYLKYYKSLFQDQTNNFISCEF